MLVSGGTLRGVWDKKKKEEKEIHLYYAEFCIHCYFIL